MAIGERYKHTSLLVSTQVSGYLFLSPSPDLTWLLPRASYHEMIFPGPASIGFIHKYIWGSPTAQQQRIHLQCRGHRTCGFNPWVRKIPWRRAWQPTPVFFPGESHGQRSLAGYSPQGCNELDATEHACTYIYIYMYIYIYI